MKNLLKNLIRINSVNPALSENGGGEAELAHFIGDYLKNLGLDVHYQEWDGNRANVIGILKGSGHLPWRTKYIPLKDRLFT